MHDHSNWIYELYRKCSGELSRCYRILEIEPEDEVRSIIYRTESIPKRNLYGLESIYYFLFNYFCFENHEELSPKIDFEKGKAAAGIKDQERIEMKFRDFLERELKAITEYPLVKIILISTLFDEDSGSAKAIAITIQNELNLLYGYNAQRREFGWDREDRKSTKTS